MIGSLRRGLVIGLALTLGAVARADMRTTYAAGPIIFPGGATPSVNSLAANRNPGSPYYGYVYVLERVSHKVLIYRPDPAQAKSAAMAYVDTGLTITMPTPDSLSPWLAAVGSDDTVWLASPNENAIFTAPPVPPTGTDVTPVKQIDVTGAGVGTTPFNPFLRGLNVIGPVTAAKVYITYGNAPSGVQKWTGSAKDWQTPGSFARDWQVDTGAAPLSLTQGPYAAAVDGSGNVYVANKGGAASVFIKIDDAGNVVSFTAPPPAGLPVTSNLGVACFVPDASYSGGGYLYYNVNITVSGTPATFGLRYDMSGNYLDGWGPALATPPASYSTVAVTGISAGVPYADNDAQGNIYQRFRNAGNSAVMKIFRHVPALAAAGSMVSAGGAIRSSATAVDGVAYFGADDGKIYAYDTTTGNPVPGFPADISAYLGATVKVQSRTAVYFGATGKSIYATTDRGDVVKVKPDGTPAWAYSAFGPGTGNVSTPAVTPLGEVVVGVNGANGVVVLKLDEAAGGFLKASPMLAPISGAIGSPAVEGNKIYVPLLGGVTGDLMVLDAVTLTPLASMAAGEGATAPPYVLGPAAYMGSMAGRLWKVNSATLAADPAFGPGGFANIGEPLPSSPFPLSIIGAPPFIATGSSMGKVWVVDENGGIIVPGPTGLAYVDTGDATAIVGGLAAYPDVANPAASTFAFGTSAGKFVVVPWTNPTAAKTWGGMGAITVAPTVDRSTGRYLAGSLDANLYAFPVQ